MRLLATLLVCLTLAGAGPAAACYTSDCYAPPLPAPVPIEAIASLGV